MLYLRQKIQTQTDLFGPEKFRNKYRIKSARLESYDYSSNGSYFVTICTDNKKCYFGRIKDSQISLSGLGNIVNQFWEEIPIHFPFIVLDAFVVMPNHIHGILIIDKEYILDGHIKPKYLRDKERYGNKCKNNCRDVALQRLCNGSYSEMSKISPNIGSISTIIRSYKSICSKMINRKFPNKNFKWQSRFYDHIIKNEKSYNNIQEYILSNVLNWEKDRYFA